MSEPFYPVDPHKSYSLACKRCGRLQHSSQVDLIPTYCSICRSKVEKKKRTREQRQKRCVGD